MTLTGTKGGYFQLDCGGQQKIFNFSLIMSGQCQIEMNHDGFAEIETSKQNID